MWKGDYPDDSNRSRKTESWAYSGPNGWVPAQEVHTGIDYEIGFGFFFKTRNEIRLAIETRSGHSNDRANKYSYGRTLCKSSPQLAYIHRRNPKRVAYHQWQPRMCWTSHKKASSDFVIYRSD